MRLTIVQLIHSLQPEDGDAFIGRVQVRVAAHFRRGFQQSQHLLVKDRKLLACDKLFDDTLLLPQPERLAQADGERPALAL